MCDKCTRVYDPSVIKLTKEQRQIIHETWFLRTFARLFKVHSIYNKECKERELIKRKKQEINLRDGKICQVCTYSKEYGSCGDYWQKCMKFNLNICDDEICDYYEEDE